MATHIIVDAKAGTGKTTTGVEGVNILLSEDSSYEPPFTPSPQQEAIWDLLLEEPAESIIFCAFNKSVANVLSDRVPAGCEASTIHSLGYAAYKRAYGIRRNRPTSWKTTNLIEELLDKDIRELRKESYEFVSGCQRLVSLCKLLLVGWYEDYGFSAEHVNQEDLELLCNLYDISLGDKVEEAYELVPRLLDNSCDEELCERGVIDFDDMVWLPVVNDLKVTKRDLAIVDESQDLNPCQQELVLKAGKRMMLVGDPNQAIYGFAGADVSSMQHMQTRLEESDRGCTVLPLTVTYRCPKKVVKLANKIVPNYQAHESNGEGVVENWGKEKLLTTCDDGDMVLCRTNAPLVGTAFRFITAGKKATIVGGDIGKGLISLVKKLKAVDVTDLMDKVEAWHQSESEKAAKMKYANEAKLIALSDKKDCIMAFCEGCLEVDDVVKSIDAMFSDTTREGVRLSSIHRAKGLEAQNVHILCPEQLPHPMASSKEQRVQEDNLKYVAITRTMEKLVWVASE